jgi:23S rRNA (cytosine1962-C5)-methyltransferase
MNLHKAELHPESLRHLEQGHPWVIKDKYTDKFKAKERFLLANGPRKDDFILISDTAHHRIKARLWAKVSMNTLAPGQDYFASFLRDLEDRLKVALEKRLALYHQQNRQNIFLVFGEADQLPGLKILLLGHGIVIQSYARFWKKFQKDLIPLLRELFGLLKFDVQWISWQERDLDKESALHPVWGKMPQSMIIKEYGVFYGLKFDQGYDLGLYTDMAAIRSELEIDWSQKRVLNLYSYTGAWSLFPLEKGASKVVSVDLSSKYLDWLDENLNLNPHLKRENHHRIDKDTLSALRDLIKNNEKFDVIFCDPPSFSSDGKKTSSSLKIYQELLPLFNELLAPNGHSLCFINTHSVTRKKFEERMRESIKDTSLKIIDKLILREDCPRLKNFPEGDYLKGLHLKKIES